MINYLKNLLEIFGIVFLRFRPLPRLWNVWLVGVNLTCLLFIQHLEAQVVLGVTSLAVVIMTVLYGRAGFTRLLGVAHLLWIPMFAWIATRMPEISDPMLRNWLLLLFVTNAVSFIVDAADVSRFLRGERAPHYSWN